MPIEFNCHVCGKLLRTVDEKAGKTAKCPGCGEKLTVPGSETEPDNEFGDDEYGDEDEFAPAPSGGAKRNCPMCGESISRKSARCEYCGEKVGGGGRGSRRGEVRSTQIEVGEVISTAWEIFKSEMGVCVGGYTIMVVITVVIAGARVICSGVLNVGVAGMGGNQQPNPGALILVMVVGLVVGLIEAAIRLYLEAGFKRLLLNVARGKNAEIGDLFSAGPFFLRYLGNSILFGLMVAFGTAACIVPGIILALMFWPFGYLILDRNLPGMECLSRAKEITEGNWGSIFVLALAAFGINILGVCALCIGLIFTAPLTMLMFTVAYCRMSGRATARV
jgi:predicted RNA-binding Zn-ribbon protein involved in translation (DUF1610 family)